MTSSRRPAARATRKQDRRWILRAAAMSAVLGAPALAAALSSVQPVSGEEGSKPVNTDTPAPAWTASLTVGKSGSGSETVFGYSWFKEGMGTLSEDRFSAGEKTIEVMVPLLSNGHLAISLRPKPSSGFGLTVDGARFASADASELQSYSIAGFIWTASDLDWAEDDTVALSLTLVEDATQATEATEVPARPQGLSLVSVTHEAVELSWNDPGDATVTGYQILRRLRDKYEVGRFDIIVADTGSASTSYTDDDGSASTRYVYRVKAINAVGLSQQSTYLRANTPATPAPAAPTGLEVSVTASAASLSWDDPDDDTVTGYRITRRDRDVEGSAYAVIVADNGTATSYGDQGVSAGGRYAWQVLALRGETRSEPSEAVEADLPSPPAAPTGLSGSATADAATLSWDDPDDETIPGYRILRRERDVEPSLSITVSHDTGSTATSFVDGTVETASKYAYRILALNTHGAGPESAEAEVDTPPDPPSGLIRDSSRDIVIAPLESWSGLEWSATGIWSDGERMWVLIDRVDEVLVFDLKTGEQLTSHSLGCGPVCPRDIWSDGETAWISNNWCGVTNQIYAYDLDTWARMLERDIQSPDWELKGIAGDRDTIRVVSSSSDDPDCDDPMYTYELDDLERGDNRCGVASGMGRVFAAYSDGQLFWTMNFMGGLRVLELDSNTRVPSLEWFTTWNLGLFAPGGLWSDGGTMWISDARGTLIRAFSMPERARLRLLKFTDVDIRPFLPAIFAYEAEVANDVSVTTITAEPAFGNGLADVSISAAGVTADADSQTDGYQVNLSVGENVITIVVLATDGVGTATYSVTVTRAAS